MGNNAVLPSLRPCRWHKLKGKPDKDRKKGEKERGDLEVRVAFTVKSGSLLDVSADKKKNKSITSLKNLGDYTVFVFIL